MDMTRREFIKGLVAGGSLFGGRLFAVPHGLSGRVAVRPLSSLGTKGRAIGAKFRI